VKRTVRRQKPIVRINRRPRPVHSAIVGLCSLKSASAPAIRPPAPGEQGTSPSRPRGRSSQVATPSRPRRTSHQRRNRSTERNRKRTHLVCPYAGHIPFAQWIVGVLNLNSEVGIRMGPKTCVSRARVKVSGRGKKMRCSLRRAKKSRNASIPSFILSSSAAASSH